VKLKPELATFIGSNDFLYVETDLQKSIFCKYLSCGFSGICPGSSLWWKLSIFPPLVQEIALQPY
jgi:hypothetical protein